ncbi:MAG: hypothetical protein JW896_18305 [Deltaproteobacteria bacterium]|nr:hypothetical protein [Deltaproteobacteria bacterium]
MLKEIMMRYRPQVFRTFSLAAALKVVLFEMFFLLSGNVPAGENDVCVTFTDSDFFSINTIEIDGIEIQQSSSPVIRVDAYNRVHLLTYNSADNRLYYLNDSSGRLQVVTTIQPRQGDFFRVTMEIDDTGHPHIVFSVTEELSTGMVSDATQYHTDFFYTEIVDGRMLSPVSVAVVEQKIYMILLRIDRQGLMRIAFTSTTESMEQALLSNFYYTHNRSGGFTQPVPIVSNLRELMNPCLEIGHNDFDYAFGIVHSWEAGGFSVMRWSIDAEGNATEETVYSNAGRNEVATQIMNLNVARRSDNLFHLIFQETDLYYTNDSSGVFSEPERIAYLREDMVWGGHIVQLAAGSKGIHAVFNEPEPDSCWNQYYWRQSDHSDPALLAARVEGISSSNFSLKINHVGYLHWIFGCYTGESSNNHWSIFHAESKEPVEDPIEPDSPSTPSSSDSGCFIRTMVSD